MTTPTQRQDIARWAGAAEGQFFERKSAWDRSGSRPKQRKASDIARDVAETLAAMANADGGELVIGMEDDGARFPVSRMRRTSYACCWACRRIAIT